MQVNTRVVPSGLNEARRVRDFVARLGEGKADEDVSDEIDVDDSEGTMAAPPTLLRRDRGRCRGSRSSCDCVIG